MASPAPGRRGLLTFPSEEAAQQFAHKHGRTVDDLRRQADADGVEFIEGQPDSTFGKQGPATFSSEQEMRDFGRAYGMTAAALAKQAEADGVELISSRPGEILAIKEQGDQLRAQAADEREQTWIQQIADDVAQ